jgi:STE24 endopeptidase
MTRFASMVSAAILVFALGASTGHGQTGTAPPAPQASPPAGSANEPQAAGSSSASYTLTPERRAQAIAYSRALYTLYFLGSLISIGIYFLIWRARIAAAFRDWAYKISPRLFVQCLIFVPLFLATAKLLKFPLSFYSGYVLEHHFGLSTQGFASWLMDWGKGLAITAATGVPVLWVFYTVARRSPRRWWFYFWLASIPLALAFILLEPYVIDPLFYKFTPLQKTEPALVERIVAMLYNARISIPRDRILVMDASSRTREIDAYVAGLGWSKRVVVWDTTLKALGPDELLLVLGHETGHYALDHIPKEFALDETVALAFFFLGFLTVGAWVKRATPHWKFEGIGDLASLPILLIVLTLMVLLSDPIVNGISRHYEHQADQFGLEVAYGIVPDPNAAEVHSLQVLGDVDLSDPDPSPLINFWLYTHPPLDERIRFAATYKPWAEGKPMELLSHSR